MSAFDRQLSAAQRQHDNASPDFNDEPFWNAADKVGRAQEPSDVAEMVERLVAAENALALVAAGKHLHVASLGPIQELAKLARGLSVDVEAEMRNAGLEDAA